MISSRAFKDAVISNLGKRIDLNNEQLKAIVAQPNKSQFIVAGPGSGKTTVMVLKVLKLIFVNDIDPSMILVTTFTKKAAAELRSGILGWGDKLKIHFLEIIIDDDVRNKLNLLNLNRITTGTIDSISQDALNRIRLAGNPQPIVVEEFVSNALMIRELFKNDRYQNEDLQNFITDLKGSGIRGISELSETLLEIKDRIYYDQIDINKLKLNRDAPGLLLSCDLIDSYILEMKDRLLHDFARIEDEFLSYLKSGELDKSYVFSSP